MIKFTVSERAYWLEDRETGQRLRLASREMGGGLNQFVGRSLEDLLRAYQAPAALEEAQAREARDQLFADSLAGLLRDQLFADSLAGLLLAQPAEALEALEEAQRELDIATQTMNRAREERDRIREERDQLLAELIRVRDVLGHLGEDVRRMTRDRCTPKSPEPERIPDLVLIHLQDRHKNPVCGGSRGDTTRDREVVRCPDCERRLGLVHFHQERDRVLLDGMLVDRAVCGAATYDPPNLSEAHVNCPACRKLMLDADKGT